MCCSRKGKIIKRGIVSRIFKADQKARTKSKRKCRINELKFKKIIEKDKQKREDKMRERKRKNKMNKNIAMKKEKKKKKSYERKMRYKNIEKTDTI